MANESSAESNLNNISDSSIDQALQEVYQKTEFQEELPLEKAPVKEDSDLPEWLEAIFEFLSGLAEFFPTSLMGIILYCLAGALIVFAIVYIAKSLRGKAYKKSWKESKNKDGDLNIPAPIKISAEPLGDANALAEQGEFAQALHVLLLRTIEELSTELSYEPEVSYTSREILATAPFAQEAAEAFERLTHTVEYFYFGQKACTLENYKDGVDSFKSFQAACLNNSRSERV